MKKHIKTIVIILIIIFSIIILNFFLLIMRYGRNNNEFRDELNKSEILKSEIGEILYLFSNINYNKEINEKLSRNSMIVITKNLKVYKLKVDYIYNENVPCYEINNKYLCETNESFSIDDYIVYIENNEYDLSFYQRVNRYTVKNTASNIWNIVYSLEDVDIKNIKNFDGMQNIKTYYDVENECWLVQGDYKDELYNMIISNKEYKVLAIWKNSIN